MHNASSSLTAKGALETDGMCNERKAVETDLAQKLAGGDSELTSAFFLALQRMP